MDVEIYREKQVPSPDTSQLREPPWGVKWRSSTWYITTVVTYGSMTESLCYMIAVPVIPFRLQDLGYNNISSRASWFLFAYCITMAVSTFPIAFWLHRRPWRRGPLLAATCVMQTGLFLLMFVRQYWMMILGRALQGLSCTVIWSVAFALICENVEEKNVGRHLGFAFSGISLGSIIAPPIGGGLYSALGWKEPFIFCAGVCSVELIGRWIVIEQKDLHKYRLPVAAAPETEEKRVQVVPPSTKAQDQPRAYSPEVDRLATQSEKSPSALEPNQAGQTTEPQRPRRELTPWKLMRALCSSPRSMTAIIVHFMFGMTDGAIDPTLTLRVQDIWGKDSDFVGLVYLASLAPIFIVGPITGWLADRTGAEWMAAPSALLTAPFFPLLLLKNSLPGFIVTFAFNNLFQACMLAPIGVEVAAVARETEGLGEIHQFAALNFAWAAATAIGTIAGGQMYDHLPKGWVAVCWFCFAACIACIPFTVLFTGEKPLARRLVWRQN